MGHIFKGALLLVGLAALSAAHVGSPDIYLDGNAGPYKLFVTIRTPQVIPGLAEVEIRSQTAGISEMRASPLPLSGAGAENAPLPEPLHRNTSDKQFFTGTIWLMMDGSWQVRIAVNGTQGAGTLSVPVPAIATTTRGMKWQLSATLCALGAFLVLGLTAITGAASREAKLSAGAVPDAINKRKGRIAMAASFCLIALVLWGGKTWWDSEAAVYRDRIYKPLNMRASLDHSWLRLNLSEPGWMQPEPGTIARVLFVRRMDDLVLDHDHLMHLYAIRQPGLDVIYHLHPDQAAPDEFKVELPAMPPGDYKLYADVVHENGLPETLMSAIHLPNGIAASTARPLSGDDASAETQPAGNAALGDTFALPDGYRMIWMHDGASLRVRQGTEFRFDLLAPDGSRPKDMALYMGMLGHAAFVKTDGTVFAHIHPNGTVPMAAFMLAQGNDSMAGMDMEATLPNEVAFPYGLPTAGKYRIFVQMKHGETVETGIFDATAN
jgi:hypothetical protein